MSSNTLPIDAINALNVDQAKSLMDAGEVGRVRLAWDISSDEFFQLAAVAGRAAGMRMVKLGKDFFLERQ